MEAVMAWSGMMLGPKPTKGDRGTSRKHGYIMDYHHYQRFYLLEELLLMGIRMVLSFEMF